ncbi:hypothetical protein [Alloalcanivorax marinus]|nr:hypothetical protein [Alloalcanivorax marinus]MCU5788604.1 glycine dehydrogenase subunit 2 [Alloalcanivorax marinus]
MIRIGECSILATNYQPKRLEGIGGQPVYSERRACHEFVLSFAK